jgi:hypothetical protein
MLSKTVSDKAGLPEDQIDRVLNQMADSFSQQLRSPILAFTIRRKPGLRGCHFSIIGRRSPGGLVHSSRRLQQANHRHLRARYGSRFPLCSGAL